jgi:hypothetical protein
MNIKMTVGEHIRALEELRCGRLFFAENTKGNERRRWLRLAQACRKKIAELKRRATTNFA